MSKFKLQGLLLASPDQGTHKTKNVDNAYGKSETYTAERIQDCKDVVRILPY